MLLFGREVAQKFTEVRGKKKGVKHSFFTQSNLNMFFKLANYCPVVAREKVRNVEALG